MQLTPEQMAAVQCAEPRFTISASAGSGKTRVLTERYIRHVVEQGLSPHQILTISFTLESAAEMKARITNRLRDLGRIDDAQAAEVGPIQTLDSFCRQLLITNALEAGVDPRFGILPGSDRVMEDAAHLELEDALANDELSEELLRNYLENPDELKTHLVDLIKFRRDHPWRGGEISAAAVEREFLAVLEQCEPDAFEYVHERAKKRPQWFPKEHQEGDVMFGVQSDLETLASRAIAHVRAEMRRRQEFDFSEVTRLAVELLDSQEEVCNRLRRTYAAVLVDESQDLNDHQYALINGLGIQQEMLVGDVKQSIYGFRGAAPQLFAERTDTLPVLELHQNHRTSSRGILRFIDDHLGAQLTNYKVEEFDLDADPGYQGVELWAAGDVGKNPELLAAYVETFLRETGREAKDLGILVWRQEDSKPIADALIARGISAGVIGGSKFHSVPLVRDIANLLELFNDPKDQFRLFAVLRSPIVGISLDAVLLLHATGDMWTALHEPPTEISGPEKSAIAHFLNWLEPLLKNGDRLSAWETISSVMERSQLMQAVARASNRLQNMANLRKLMEMAARAPEMGALEFAEHIRRAQQWTGDREGQAQTVSLSDPVAKVMTVHGAKGLEFPVTILASERYVRKIRPGNIQSHRLSGLSMLYLKSPKNWPGEFIAHLKTQEERSEDWRLHYVALTRAKEVLIVNIGNTEPPKNMGRPMDLFRASAVMPVVPSGLVVRESPLRLEGGSEPVN